MAEAVMSFTMIKPQASKLDHLSPFSSRPMKQCLRSNFGGGLLQKKRNKMEVKALPLPEIVHIDWSVLMAVMVEHSEGKRDLITHKSIWHLNDIAIKKVYTFYIMFTVWGCCVFGSTKDPYYDSEHYRKDGGDGTGHWVYEKQEDIEESSRAALWREELIEEIEQKVEGIRELEEAGVSKK
ncbi:photosynthetic NDH subunit of subcomplex B 4, chloroplastic [Impatiens glandulifera]|uniref:photosynthetic NDH subunit of subcomplex B 4, chloroplastic n=1 Tax=Impatiens glandulifera TaxID=253017 RepID=UPI001FB0BFB6|nr:photosynthetic NDH subunit of subcomplex B 4, chloroplastic [Impatiens glandulifera]